MIDAIHRLPRHQRIATYLQKVEGWSADEIAALLGTSVSTAYVHVSRGTRAVRAQMKPLPQTQPRPSSTYYPRSLPVDRSYRRRGCLPKVLGAVGAVGAVMACFPRALPTILAILGGLAMACIVFYSARFLRARLAEWGRRKRNARQALPARKQPPALPQGADDQAPTRSTPSS